MVPWTDFSFVESNTVTSRAGWSRRSRAPTRHVHGTLVGRQFTTNPFVPKPPFVPHVAYRSGTTTHGPGRPPLTIRLEFARRRYYHGPHSARSRVLSLYRMHVPYAEPYGSTASCRAIMPTNRRIAHTTRLCARDRRYEKPLSGFRDWTSLVGRSVSASRV